MYYYGEKKIKPTLVSHDAISQVIDGDMSSSSDSSICQPNASGTFCSSDQTFTQMAIGDGYPHNIERAWARGLGERYEKESAIREMYL